ncbi:helix-turn-helix domain-containing protein [Haemophilus paraphrohaemolyticus]|uniref:Helix-turn-helix domain-containing protein n=1 Tax=Haemophilus paraphrohaemolyticus TaxID=736 RepID=A0A369ZTR7_9PAST|nr:helix-turn-helix transcriptional regulator [Haemophilus paraphrohaemolyticus]RDF10845.1 helix-turn-helix domain-containing protein [Haemophilus paraphrohaemolyticus]
MESSEKIKIMREMNQWTQEEVAEKLGMSTTGYAKIERGQTNVSVEKLKQIAQVFNVNVAQLLDDNERFVLFTNVDNHSNYNNYFGTNEKLSLENEKLKQLLSAKESEIEALKKVIALLENAKQPEK